MYYTHSGEFYIRYCLAIDRASQGSMSPSHTKNEQNNMACWGKIERFGRHLLWALVKIIIMLSVYYIIVLKLPSEREDNKYQSCIKLPNKIFLSF